MTDGGSGWVGLYFVVQASEGGYTWVFSPYPETVSDVDEGVRI